MNITSLSRLSFFKVDKYEHYGNHMCDFSNIPRPHYCMGLITDGSGEFRFKNKSVTVKKGEIIFVPVGSTYISSWQGNEKISYISVHFSFDFPDPLTQNKKAEIQKITLSDFEKTHMHYRSMLENYEKDKALKFSVLSSFFGVMNEVYPKLEFNSLKRTDNRIEKACEYIHSHFKEDFSVDFLAEFCNMSPSHFHTVFKQITGCSPVEYKHKISIRQAELLLIENRLSIEEISEALGFNSAIYFREIFKKLTGKTPSEYRKLDIE